jgi:putative membrane protein insertion efficiency factor
LSANATRRFQVGREAAARGLFAFYKRAVSPVIHSGVGSACRFQPTCSEYATIAIAEHGIFRGALMALWRVLRCHPLHRGGFDPVPAKRGGLGDEYSGSIRAGQFPNVSQAEDR